eukprot:g37670.t1
MPLSLLCWVDKARRFELMSKIVVIGMRASWISLNTRSQIGTVNMGQSETPWLTDINRSVPPSGFVTDIHRRSLITDWDVVDSRRAYPPAGLAAIVREPLLRNPHLRCRRFEWLAEGRAVAV